jgi:hypothetical protein
MLEGKSFLTLEVRRWREDGLPEAIRDVLLKQQDAWTLVARKERKEDYAYYSWYLSVKGFSQVEQQFLFRYLKAELQLHDGIYVRVMAQVGLLESLTFHCGEWCFLMEESTAQPVIQDLIEKRLGFKIDFLRK